MDDGFSDQNGGLDITIIVVSYNTRELTLKCIRSILEHVSAVRYEIIVLDNASIDGSSEAIRANFPGVQLITAATNFGFGRANNIAAARARGGRLLLLNSDTEILDHAIDNLLKFAIANPECRIWGGRTVFADGTLNPTSCWGEATLWSIFCLAAGLTKLKGSTFFNPEGYGGWKRDTVRAVDIVTGCFLLVDNDLWQQLHGFDPIFFMYGEEADLCLRARKLGAHPTITPTATIIHHGNASEPHGAERRIKMLAGKITLLKRHQSTFSFFVGRLLFLLVPLSRMAIYGALGKVFGRAKMRRTAESWRDVWRNRHRWINGWNDFAWTKVGGDPFAKET